MTEEPFLPSGNWIFQNFATSEDEIRARHESNRGAWNEGAAVYSSWVDETITGLRAGLSNLHPIEQHLLKDILPGCETAIHLQCASGRDTLSLWLEGVKKVIGVDISDVHIANARRTSQALNAPAEWYRCDIFDTPHSLDSSADLVYTGRGALAWLQDLDRWADVVQRLLKPGGCLSIFEGHPITWLFDSEAATYKYVGVNYFSHCESSVGWPSTYIGNIGPLDKQSRKYKCLWTLGQIFQVLTRAGLSVIHFDEHPDPFWDEFPNLKPELRGRIPTTFSMIARK